MKSKLLILIVFVMVILLSLVICFMHRRQVTAMEAAQRNGKILEQARDKILKDWEEQHIQQEKHNNKQ